MAGVVSVSKAYKHKGNMKAGMSFMGATKKPKPNTKQGSNPDDKQNRGGSKDPKVTTGLPTPAYSDDVLLLAGVVYGEASTQNVYEEMAAIANVLVRQQKARNTTLALLLGSNSTFAYAASDSNQRTAAFRKASPDQRAKDTGMSYALKAAVNAIGNGKDYSNGAYFWDGADLKSNYDNHPKVKQGIKFTDPSHNIYNIKETSVDVTTYWQITKNGKLVNGEKRGSYTYVFESTAAYGGTVFWKYGDDFLKATANKKYE